MTITAETRKSQKCNGDYSLFLSFQYNYDIIQAIKSLPQRYYEPTTREWEIPIYKLDELAKKLPQIRFDVVDNISILIDNKTPIPDGFSFKTKPYEHQLECFNYGMKYDKFLLADEMGLGKTKEAIDIAVAKKIQHNYEHCLIICGVNSLKWNWVNEVNTHSNESAWILGQRKLRNGKFRVGSNKDKLEDLSNLDLLNCYFIVTNIETLRDSAIQTKLVELFKAKKIQMIVMDEAHKCKNPTSQQGKAFLKMQAETMIAMTGTPLMNNPLDLFIILKWLGYEKHAFYQFKKHYCVFGGFGGYEITGYKHLPELQDQINQIMLRRKKEDVLDLPEKTYVNEYVEMTPKQEQIYREVTAAIKANIDQIKMANNPLAELIRMRQATGYTGILSSTVAESAKIDRLEELVDEVVANGKKVVIFSNWTQLTSVVDGRLRKNYKGVVITGQTPDVERQVNVNHFQNNSECKYIIGTIGAMGTGLTLTAGTVEIFLDEPWNMALKEQCVDRCHRISQKENITVYTIMCKSTIDERIHEIVENKGMLADAIVDGKITKNKEELIDFLLS